MPTHDEIRQRILDAGIEYPAPTYWNEMGGSEKDLWKNASSATSNDANA